MKAPAPSPKGWLMHRGRRKEELTLACYLAWCDEVIDFHPIEHASVILRNHKWQAAWA